MADVVRIGITGDRKLIANLRRLEKKLMRKIIRDAMKEAMKPLLRAAIAAAPRDEGDLQRAIKDRAGRRTRLGITRAVLVDPKKLMRSGEPTGNRTAGSFQEYGTKHHPAQPFMRPALDTNGRQAINGAIIRINREAQIEAKRGSRR